MASPYYVDSTATGGTDAGTSWANAFLTFAQAVAAATTANDKIYVSHAHSESLGGDTTYTFGANVQALCLNSGTNALATTALIGAQATNYAIVFAGAFSVYFYGITFKTGTGTSAKDISIINTDGAYQEFESCKFTLNNNSGSEILSGISSSSQNGAVKFANCTFTFANAGNGLGMRSLAEFYNCTLAGTAPTNLFNEATTQAATRVHCEGCDWSVATGNLVRADDGSGTCYHEFVNCKLGASVVVQQAQTTVLNLGGSETVIRNCASGDTHYVLGHYNPFGETTVSATIYANDGASYDGGTNRCSWKIVTTANCSYYTPYVSPWIDKYQAGTSAITPRLEILRDGSATAYQNDEVWGEWSYQGTSGSTLATIVSDRMTPLGSAADQTASSLGAGDWTGENATAWFGKLTPTATITPAEIGYLRARVCVGEPSITVYVDPQMRDDGTAGSGQSRVTPSGWIDTVASSGASPRFGDRTGGLR